MWLDQIAKIDHLKIWLKHCPTQEFVMAPDGVIVWANAAFLAWAKYSQSELGRIKLDEICVLDEAAKRDIEEAKRLADKWEPVVRVNRQIIPKNDRPCWGEIAFIRYPVEGNVEYCFCTWEPLRNGTAAAFALAVERSAALEKRIGDMLDVVKKDESVARRLWNAIGEWALLNPKTAAVVFMIFLAANPYPIITTWVSRMGWIPAQPVQIEVRDPDTGSVKPASQQLINRIEHNGKEVSIGIKDQVAVSEENDVKRRSFVTAAGHVITFAGSRDGASCGDRSLPRAADGSRWQGSTDRQWIHEHHDMDWRVGRVTGNSGRLPIAEPKLSDIR